jgi:NAD(P)-dependent dehydrogenase (short-subunit alcohol dehydrogenase family)
MADFGGGVVVNVSSVHEHIPWPQFAPYCASKGGLKLLMQTAARELADRGIRIVNVAPGAIVTPTNAFVLEEPQAKQAVEEEIPIGRMDNPERSPQQWLGWPARKRATSPARPSLSMAACRSNQSLCEPEGIFGSGQTSAAVTGSNGQDLWIGVSRDLLIAS